MRLTVVLALFALSAVRVTATPLGLELPSGIGQAGVGAATPTTSAPPPPTVTPDPDSADINACAQYCAYTAVAPDLYFCGVTEAPINCVCRSSVLRGAFGECVVAQCPEFETRIDALQTQQCAQVAEAIAKKNQSNSAQQPEDDVNAFNGSATMRDAPFTFTILGIFMLGLFSL